MRTQGDGGHMGAEEHKGTEVLCTRCQTQLIALEQKSRLTPTYTKNAYEAYDEIINFNPYDVEDFLKAHELMTQGLVEESGKFRSDRNTMMQSKRQENRMIPACLSNSRYPLF